MTAPETIRPYHGAPRPEPIERLIPDPSADDEDDAPAPATGEGGDIALLLFEPNSLRAETPADLPAGATPGGLFGGSEMVQLMRTRDRWTRIWTLAISTDPTQTALARRVAHDILVYSGLSRITQRGMIRSGRDRVAVLVQSRGTEPPTACARCRDGRTFRAFPACVRVPGFYNGVCANCLWSRAEHTSFRYPGLGERCCLREDPDMLVEVDTSPEQLSDGEV